MSDRRGIVCIVIACMIVALKGMINKIGLSGDSADSERTVWAVEEARGWVGIFCGIFLGCEAGQSLEFNASSSLCLE